MKTRNSMHTTSVVAGAVAFLVMAMAMTSTVYAKDKEKLPEVSKDGLHLLKNTKVRVAYAKPGVNLDQYTKVKILDCYVQFKKNWKKDYNLNEVGLDGRVQDKDMVVIKQRLAAEFKKIFTKELQTKGGYQVVDDVGPEVLLIRPAIVNLDVAAPDLVTYAGFKRVFVNSPGQMTLFMELYDSATSELLVRVIDPQQSNWGGEASRVSNKAAADQILRRWADLLRSHLGDVKQNTGSS